MTRRIEALADWLEAHPRASFVTFAVLHSAVWTLLPGLLYANLPLDLIEALTYGREWQLGYDKLPPLPWWLVEAIHHLSGRDVAYYLFSQLVVLSAFALIWRLGWKLVGANGALAAILSVDGLHYFGFTAPKFNHDVIQLPFWALAGVSFYGALKTGRMHHWILLGIALGAALWAKYFVVMQAAPLALFLILDRDARRTLKTPGPYLAALVALLTAAPHLIWLVQHDFVPFQYAAARAAASRGISDHVARPIAFLAGQLAWLIPSFLIAIPLLYPRREKQSVAATDFDRRLLTLLTFGPAALLIAGSAVSGRALITMWGYPLWLFLGLWLVMMTGATVERTRLAHSTLAWTAVTSLYVTAFIADYAVLPHFDHRQRAVLFPGTRLAEEITGRFRAATGEPLRYVIGSMWLGGNISVYSSERPRPLIDGKPERTPWIDLSDLRRHGAVVVWTERDHTKLPNIYAAIATGAEVQPPLTLPMRRGNGAVTIGWAILKPRG